MLFRSLVADRTYTVHIPRNTVQLQILDFSFTFRTRDPDVEKPVILKTSPHGAFTTDQAEAEVPYVLFSEAGFPSGIICETWNDTEKICMAPAQG